MGAVYISRKMYFSATHVYRIAEWSDEQNFQVFGPCSNPHGHGHDYSLDVTVKGTIDDRTGMVVNITDIDRVVKPLLDAEFDGKFLDREHAYFQTRIPTTENIVQYLWDTLDGRIPGCELHKIRLRENPYLFSEKERGRMVRLTRKYHFCSAHRLHSDQLSDEENLRLFGKCNNPHGHGHNYYLEVTVQGETDPVTGMVVNLADLDEVVDRHIIRKFDHKHLNLDTEEFKALNPTSEMFAKVIWELLEPHMPNLHKVGLYETEKNYFEYSGAREEVGR